MIVIRGYERKIDTIDVKRLKNIENTFSPIPKDGIDENSEDEWYVLKRL